MNIILITLFSIGMAISNYETEEPKDLSLDEQEFVQAIENLEAENN